MSDPLGPINPAAAPAPSLPDLFVCPNCGRTVAHDVGAASLRLAVSTDTARLTAEQIATLKQQRPIKS